MSVHRKKNGGSAARAAALLAAVGMVLAGCRGSGGARAEEPAVNLGLGSLVEQEGVAATLEEPATPEPPAEEAELESFVSDQMAALEAALGAATGPTGAEAVEGPEGTGAEPAADTSLAAMVAAEPQAPEPVDAPAQEPQEPADPAARVDLLYAQLDEALGAHLQETSEPFRTAVAMIALAAAQGRDPLEAIGPGTAAGGRLSPAERTSAEAVAGLLGTLLSPGEQDAEGRASVLQELASRLTQDIGLRIPVALLCTRVRGFGRYEPFSRTDFLAGRPIRALVYVEVDGFEHRPVDTSRLGGLEVEDRWSVELSEELALYHDPDGVLAWRRPAEKVVETSRNRQRDFYLLVEIELPRTLTVGAYKLKVTVRDEVSGAVAEKVIPIGIVADPALAWTPE